MSDAADEGVTRAGDGRLCVHCKQWVAIGEPHDCASTTEAALTRHLSEDLRDAWERLRETAVEFGEQRIYASHHSIMFSRRVCYCFVRPRRTYLEVCVFLDRAVTARQVRRVTPVSRARIAHLLRIEHRDEVEAPITDWMRRAYDLVDPSAPRTPAPADAAPRRAAKKR